MKSDRQILDSEYNEILLQTVAVIEKSRSMLAVQVREGHRVWYVDSLSSEFNRNENGISV